MKYFLFLLIVLSGLNAFTQAKDLVDSENKLIDIHIKIDKRLDLGRTTPYDSLKYLNDSFEYWILDLDRDFEKLVSNDPRTLEYPFQRLVDSSLLQISTSTDGNFRIYNLAAWQLSTEIYQWRGNGKVFTKVVRYPKDSSGRSGMISTVTINGKPHYLPVTATVVWPKHSIQSVAAWRINGNRLEPVKLFKNNATTSDRIDVPMSFANFLGKTRDSLPYIQYDDKEKKLYIPFVNGINMVTNSYFIYELKGEHLEFTTIGEMKKIKSVVVPHP